MTQTSAWSKPSSARRRGRLRDARRPVAHRQRVAGAARGAGRDQPRSERAARRGAADARHGGTSPATAAFCGQRLHRVARTPRRGAVVAEHVEAGAGRATAAPRRPAAPARSTSASRPRGVSWRCSGTPRPASAASISAASRPISATARAWRATGAASGAKSCPLPSPPRITHQLAPAPVGAQAVERGDGGADVGALAVVEGFDAVDAWPRAPRGAARRGIRAGRAASAPAGSRSALASASAASALAALWRPRMRSASAGIRRCRCSSCCLALAALDASRRPRSARTSQAMPFSIDQAEVARALRRVEAEAQHARGTTSARGLARRLTGAGARHHRHRPRGSSRLSTISRVRAEDARLGRGVGGHRAVPVEVVLRDVEHRGRVGSKPCTPSSWKLDSSSTQTSGSASFARLASSASASVSSSVGPMLPATATRLPARSTSSAVSAVVVVLPLVPVMASTCGA